MVRAITIRCGRRPGTGEPFDREIDENTAMTNERPIIVWLRQDLRLADQPALAAATATGRPVLPVYVLDSEIGGRWRLGGASRWWLHGSLAALDAACRDAGGLLLLRRGPVVPVLCELARVVGAGDVFWNRHVEPFWRQAEAEAARQLAAAGVTVRTFPGSLLFAVGEVIGRNGRPPRVFTPFWKACLRAAPPAEPLPAPDRIDTPSPLPAGDALEDWGLLPRAPDWAGGLRETWAPGERAALARLERFLADDLAAYRDNRDRPEPAVTSALSPHLHFGEISPRQIWHATAMRAAHAPTVAAAAEAFLRELGWREFYANILVDAPSLPDEPLDVRFADFPWSDDRRSLDPWRKGRTGYPIVDAGMRQLWHVGWMHNRVRMIVASFLIKDLLIPWQEGEAWFWDTLVDADLANNAGSWQWVAGCGTDAAPYFRVFNPTTQGERFDPRGDYVRRWIPELAALPDRWIHRPWQAPPLELAAAGVRLGETYPLPVIDHTAARERALAAFAALDRRG
jgi:deoxyribodipyrimidine photo-lyase